MKTKKINKLKAIAIIIPCMAIAFYIGVQSNNANTVEASAIYNLTDKDRIEMMQGTINRLESDKQALSAQFVDNIRVIPFEYDDCINMFMDFYAAYPNYHLEDESGSIVIDYKIPNPQEEAAQYCGFIIDDFAATHTK